MWTLDEFPVSHLTTPSARAGLVAEASYDATVTDTVARLLAIALRGLPRMRGQKPGQFAQTARLSTDRNPSALRLEGENLRYAAIVALGASRLPVDQQEAVLGQRLDDLVSTVMSAALRTDDPGAVALAVWAGAETGLVRTGDALLDRLLALVGSDTISTTVDSSWGLTALVAARDLADTAEAADKLCRRLTGAQGSAGIFPHVLPPATLPRLRSHVGCFADQVYPIQALARYHAATGNAMALEAADRCALRIGSLQGADGQWWWHYDARTGGVIEGYPVYSVHQHAMGPMALLDLAEAGGIDSSAGIAAGLRWLEQHPEVEGSLVAGELGTVWRKVGRREPRKAMRSLRAASTAVTPSLRFGWLDRLLPASRIDTECRPYELGWLLYSWLAHGVVAGLKAGPPPAASSTDRA